MTTPRPHTAPAAPRPPRDEYGHARRSAIGAMESLAEWLNAEWPAAEWPDTPSVTVEGWTYDDEGDFDEAKIHGLDPLSFETRSAWTVPGDEMQPDEIRAVLTTGGPHVEIRCTLEGNRPRLLCSDWYLPLKAVPLTGDLFDALTKYAARLSEYAQM